MKCGEGSKPFGLRGENMDEKKFTEKDKEILIDFLNHIAKKASLTHSVQESIEFFKLLSHIQQNLIPKIDANILEVKKVHLPKDNDKDLKL